MIEAFVGVLTAMAFVSLAGHLIAAFILSVEDEKVPAFLMGTGAISGFVFGGGAMLV